MDCVTNIVDTVAVNWEKPPVQVNTRKKTVLVQIPIRNSVNGGPIHKVFQIVPNMDTKRNPSALSVCVCI